MDNIATQLQQLATIKANLANVISTYGGEVPEGFSNYAETFSTLLENAGGSGGGSEEPELIAGTLFIDENGVPTEMFNTNYENYYSYVSDNSKRLWLWVTNYNGDNVGADCTVSDQGGVVTCTWDSSPGDSTEGMWLLEPFSATSTSDMQMMGYESTGTLYVDIQYNNLQSVVEIPYDFSADWPQPKTLTNKLYNLYGTTNYGSDNSASPLTSQSDYLLLFVQDSDGVYLTENEIQPGDMMGYCTVESGIMPNPGPYGDRVGQTYFKIKPFDGWTLSRFQEEGVDLSGSIPIEYEYYDVNTGEPIQQTNGPVEIYYDFTGLQE